MYGSLPVMYVISRKDMPESKWYLKACGEDMVDVCVWTSKAVSAQTFTDESKCKDYVAKYLSKRDVQIDKHTINPYALAMAAAFGG